MALSPARFSLKASRGSSICDILIEEGIARDIYPLIESLTDSSITSLVLITDSNLTKYGEKLRRDLSKRVKTNLILFPAGEKHKTFATAGFLLSKLASLNVDRNGVAVCFGGGVVGDLGGFVCSIYKRGIRYFQVPTTLLAQIDSSIGGKTGVDSGWGKNQIGTFYEPRGVFIDPLLLDSLPKRELINGIGEIIKCSIIASKQLFERLVRADLRSLEQIKQFIPECCKIKVGIVSKDEREGNLRSILNYGHTVGHAIEAASDYSLSHGRCVILGMLAEGWIARELGVMERDEFEKQEDLLLKNKPLRRRSGLESKILMEYAIADKKSSSGVIRMCLPEKVGKMHVTENGSYLISVSRALFKSSIDYLKSLE